MLISYIPVTVIKYVLPEVIFSPLKIVILALINLKGKVDKKILFLQNLLIINEKLMLHRLNPSNPEQVCLFFNLPVSLSECRGRSFFQTNLI